MTSESRVTVHKGAAALIAAALVLTGAGASYLAMRSRTFGPAEPTSTLKPANAPSVPAASSNVVSSGAGGSVAPLADVVVSLAPDAVTRAGIIVAPVVSGQSGSDVRLPGVVEPNAYREVKVTSLVAGRITWVSAELGAHVRRGQTLAQIYSPELAEIQTKYVSARAMLDAHDRELQRTQKLVEIGAASRQELERIHAEHAAQTAAVQSARAQLELLGMPAATIEALGPGSKVAATTAVPAPLDGVVTERTANSGLNVDAATPLFTVVDLSTVWITADVYEQDFARVRVGNAATVTAAAYPGLSLRGRVSYIDPQVNPETRTAKIRIEVPNPRADLRLGMFTDVMMTGSPGASVVLVPRNAVQNVGNRTVVYVAHPKEPGKFTEREVRLGRSSAEHVEVIVGLHAGDSVVTEGSFFVRAERERLGLRTANPTNGAGSLSPSAQSDRPSAQAKTQTAKVTVTEQGFEPARITLRAGTPARLTFVRTSDKTCATEVVFPSLKIKRALPLNKPVEIEFTPAKTGEITFACGMNMLKGAVVVQ